MSFLSTNMLDNYEKNEWKLGRDISAESLADAYAANPERLKNLGMEIPGSLADKLFDKPEIANNPDFKFVMAVKAPWRPEIDKQTLLNEVAERGFDAGYGAEAFVSAVRKDLEKGRADYESNKKVATNYEANVKRDAELKKEVDIQEGMYNMLCACDMQNRDTIGDMDYVQLQQRMVDAAMGKEVPPLTCPLKKSSPFKRLFMKKSDKVAEDKRIAEEQAVYARINAQTAEFVAKYANSPLLPPTAGGPASELDEQLRTKRDEISRLQWPITNYKYNKEQINTAIQTYEKLEASCQKASNKLDYQYNVQKDARETSGTKDVQYDSDFNTLAEKEKLRAEHPEMSARELYGALRQMRAAKAKAPDTAVKLTTQQMSKLKAETRE